MAQRLIDVPLQSPLLRRFSPFKTVHVLATVAVDALLVATAFSAAYGFRVIGDPVAAAQLRPADTEASAMTLYTAIVLGTFAVRGLYVPRRGVSRIDSLYNVASGLAVAWILCLAVTVLLYRSIGPPRLVLVYWGLFAVILTWLGRVIIDLVVRAAHRHGTDIERVLIVGDGPQAEFVAAQIREAPELGYEIIGCIGESVPECGGAGGPAGLPLLGNLGDVALTVRAHRVGSLIIAWPGIPHMALVELVTSCTREHVNIAISPDVFELMAREVQTSELNGMPLMRIRDVALRGWSRVVKRAMDVTVSWLLLVALSPFMLLLGLLVKLTSPAGPVLFVQERVGLDARPFEVIKFRSMHPNAEEESGPVWATREDPRRTPLGRLMRRFSVDELPQLANVLIGEMSLVGPRPERPEFVAQFSRVVPRYQERHREKAGLTGWAQVNGQRGQSNIEDRTKYDVFYVENWSLAFDVKIILKTVAAVLRDRNAY